jgi:hypothetical protein
MTRTFQPTQVSERLHFPCHLIPGLQFITESNFPFNVVFDIAIHGLQKCSLKDSKSNKCTFEKILCLTVEGARGSLVVEELDYKKEGRWFENR